MNAGTDNHSAASGRRGMIAWFIENPVAANLLMLFIIVAGSLTAVTLRKEFIPEISTGVITIYVEYPGASPESVDEGVCTKVEEALSGIDDIKRIEASAYEQLASFRITLENDADADAALNTIRSRIEGIETFPELVKKPVLTKETLREGVLWIILSADMDEGQMKTMAQQIKDELLNRTQVRQAEIQGTRDNEIAIEISEARLRQYGLTLEEVGLAVQRSSLDLPGGVVKTTAGEILVRTTGQARDGRRFADIVVRSDTDGQRITLGDVATVSDSFEEADWFLTYQGEPAVGIQVFRVGDQSTLEVADAARDFIHQRQQTLPEGVSLSIIADTSVMLRDRLELMLKNLLSGAVLVFAALILFLQTRVAFWVMAGIPVSFLGAVWLMPTPLIDSSINMITLFGCILVIGILVDDAIVIGENIHTTVQQHGSSMSAVIRGVEQVAMPATFGVLTTMAAFIPMLMIPGINGKLWRGIALVVVACLFFSLVESKWILPSHLAHARLLTRRKKGNRVLSYLQGLADDGLQWVVARVYRPAAGFLFQRRYSTLAAFIGLMLVAIIAVHTGRVRLVFFPDIEEDLIEVELNMAAGTPSLETREATRRIEAAARAVNEAFRRETGRDEDIIRNIVAFSGEETHVWFYAELLPSEQRDIGAVEIIRRWREHTGDIAGAVSLDFSGTAAQTGEPVHFELYSRNAEHLKAAAREIKQRLSTYPGVFDIKDSAPRGKAEIKLALKPMARNLGITTQELALQVRQAFYGLEAQTFQRGRDEVKVIVRYPKNERRSLYNLHNMIIRTENGDALRLDDVAVVSRTTSPAVVERFNGRRVLHVTANVDKNVQEPGRVIDGITVDCLSDLEIQYPGLQFDLGGEAREQKETMAAMGRGGVLALFAIYALMAIPLRSYLQPLIIMSAIPFGLVGAVAGHWLLGLPVSILSVCGMVALSGVVVNDSLVMVSFVNEQRAAGRPYAQAVQEAGTARFRAIMLTSLTTFCGLLPMMMERSIQAQHLIPMAVSLAFGILFATVITLVLVPVIYLVGLDVRRLFRRGKWVRQTEAGGGVHRTA